MQKVNPARFHLTVLKLRLCMIPADITFIAHFPSNHIGCVLKILLWMRLGMSSALPKRLKDSFATQPEIQITHTRDGRQSLAPVDINTQETARDCLPP